MVIMMPPFRDGYGLSACENKLDPLLTDAGPRVDTRHRVSALAQVSSVAEPSTKITWTPVGTHR